MNHPSTYSSGTNITKPPTWRHGDNRRSRNDNSSFFMAAFKCMFLLESVFGANSPPVKGIASVSMTDILICQVELA